MLAYRLESTEGNKMGVHGMFWGGESLLLICQFLIEIIELEHSLCNLREDKRLVAGARWTLKLHAIVF